ncbi:MAG TPA: polysaccharide biosynthesis/export family protein [Pyrinomonadaceae bacterium]|jgi:protein involved in polysaccharide export with SLBB domain|nr:polysaccharide biosynthesis/export family protein [Pyrinomonadaceae bacterium]
MNSNNRITAALTLILAASAINVFAQTPTDTTTRQRTAAPTQDKDKNRKPANGERLEPDDTARPANDVPADTQANRVEQMSEEAAIVPYYNNFFSTYRLGPEDVISVVVFNQDRYSRAGITIPPSGRVALALIPGGVFVNGRTVEEVADIIKKKYDEFIIDPQVTVSLDKAASYRYSIVGDVGQPGIRLMNHRMTVTEAIAEAGGVLPTGDRSKIIVLRRQNTGMLAQIPVNVSAIYKGKVPDSTYLVPGDQIIVPGNKWKTMQKIMSLTPIASFARIFAPVPF